MSLTTSGALHILSKLEELEKKIERLEKYVGFKDVPVDNRKEKAKDGPNYKSRFPIR